MPVDAKALAALSPDQLRAAVDALPPEQSAALKQMVVAAAWRTGQLEYKYHATQKRIAEAIERSTRRQFFVLCSRRTGKSYMLLTRLFARARRQPGARLLFLAPTAKAAREIAGDLAQSILNDCPTELRPEFNAMQSEFVFKHSSNVTSIVRLKGVNGETYENLRGAAQDEIIVDECGQMDHLRDVVKSVCLPMLLTTKGRLLMASTPPRSPGHDSAQLYSDLADRGSACLFTIRDTPHVDEADKAEMLLEMGEAEERIPGILAGKLEPETTEAQREYFCEFVLDANLAVVPEYGKARPYVYADPGERPERFTAYVSMDPGQKDKTGVLFMYYDFLRAKIVVEDELLLDHPSTVDVARAIKAKEAEIWGDRYREPIRILDAAGDGGLRLIRDFRTQFKMEWRPARKDDSLAAINLMRSTIQQREIFIHPRCRNLDRQLKTAIWSNSGKDFQRTDTGPDTHMDLVAALKYGIRMIDRKANPYPAQYFEVGGPGGLPSGTFVSPKRRSRRRKAGQLGLWLDTPVGRTLAGDDD